MPPFTREMSRLSRIIPRRHAADSSESAADGTAELPQIVDGESRLGDGEPHVANVRERGMLRRRLRYLRRVRDLELRDLGGLVYDLQRFNQERGDLVRGKLERLAATDAELRRVELALDDVRPLTDLRIPGIGGTCLHCGEYFPSDARYCSHCGNPVGPSEQAAAATPAPSPTAEEQHAVAAELLAPSRAAETAETASESAQAEDAPAPAEETASEPDADAAATRGDHA